MDTKWLIDTFGNKCLCRIVGYHWNDFASNQRLLRETDSTFITYIVHQCQLRLYRHVALNPEADLAHWVVSVRDNPEWRWPRGRPWSSWLEQPIDPFRRYLGWEGGPAWRLAWRDPQTWRRRVDEATRPRRMSPLID